MAPPMIATVPVASVTWGDVVIGMGALCSFEVQDRLPADEEGMHRRTRHDAAVRTRFGLAVERDGGAGFDVRQRLLETSIDAFRARRQRAGNERWPRRFQYPRLRSTRPISGSPRACRRRFPITASTTVSGWVMLAIWGVSQMRG